MASTSATFFFHQTGTALIDNIDSAALAVFASPHFDANDYANAVLAGESYQPAAESPGSALQPTPGKIAKQPSTLSTLSEPAKEDLSVAISKLSVGIDDVSKQLKSVVSLCVSSSPIIFRVVKRTAIFASPPPYIVVFVSDLPFFPGTLGGSR